MAEVSLQRQVLHVVDAVVAGQGDGPLSPQPLPLGLILAGQNAAAVDWVGAHLLGYDPERCPSSARRSGIFNGQLRHSPRVMSRSSEIGRQAAPIKCFGNERFCGLSFIPLAGVILRTLL